ncbi:hypothetical protein pipiens_011334 [Culex pipiens pipiens]|uniref:Secreted protein n=1 Tax=Culex pipiens pipiens TaxID=38569 RepID=A0ABD1D6S5_CULPP
MTTKRTLPDRMLAKTTVVVCLQTVQVHSIELMNSIQLAARTTIPKPGRISGTVSLERCTELARLWPCKCPRNNVTLRTAGGLLLFKFRFIRNPELPHTEQITRFSWKLTGCRNCNTWRR